MSLIRSITLCVLLGCSMTAAAVSTPEQLIGANCAGCHQDTANPDAPFSRMTNQRKTPEGWQMTLFRMQQVHGVQFIDPAEEMSPAEVKRVLVRHFADRNGLAPSETAPYRYILEQRLNTIEQHDNEQYAQMCARCHSGARVGLQRRTEQEWTHLVHFHLAQFPTTEYSMMGRDRDWIGIALNEMVPLLSEQFPMQSSAWDQWTQSPAIEFEGNWRVIGRMHEKGRYDGIMQVTAGEDRGYSVALQGQFENGESFEGTGQATVFTGYEWRATLSIDGVEYRQVFAAATDGTLSGRMFQTEHTELGLDFLAARNDGTARVMGVYPNYLRQGQEQNLTVIGTDMSGEIDLGADVEIIDRIASDSQRMVVRVKAAEQAMVGTRSLTVGATSAADALTVFDTIDRIQVLPEYAIGRVGDNGGSTPRRHALFDAIAWNAGPDGESGTADDVRVGIVPANWHVEPWDEQAERDEDVRFTGDMDTVSGRFSPGPAGPNPERKYGTNNAGNLKVVATVTDGVQTLNGEAHLIVTVQRWNNPPIP